jgi:lipopolysaccharide/colanic/teichoic acid biosynthesis glycosyltransferase
MTNTSQMMQNPQPAHAGSPANRSVLPAAAPLLALQRAFDVVLSGLLLILALPIFLLTILAICLGDRGHVFYRQTRAGLNGKPFSILKFRSMSPNRISQLDKCEVGQDHPLVTPVGRWIRRTKIDELPQLLNVFLGHMSLVGPRPRPVEQLADDGDFERRRMVRRPGMTGWAQINGGIDISWPDRILLDVWYVDHWSLWLDLKILALTLPTVVSGPATSGHALAEAAAHALRSYPAAKSSQTVCRA